jgi:hypothetical protein
MDKYRGLPETPWAVNPGRRLRLRIQTRWIGIADWSRAGFIA